MKKIIILISGLFLLTSCTQPVADVHDDVHFHVGLQVFKDNAIQDYSDFRYMYFKPCGTPKSEWNSIKDRVHLHDQIGDVLHIHDEHVTWGDAFKSMEIAIGSGATLYVNGASLPDFLGKDMQAFDSATLFLGKNTDMQKKHEGRITKSRIEEIEKFKAENCGKE